MMVTEHVCVYVFKTDTNVMNKKPYDMVALRKLIQLTVAFIKHVFPDYFCLRKHVKSKPSAVEGLVN